MWFRNELSSLAEVSLYKLAILINCREWIIVNPVEETNFTYSQLFIDQLIDSII